MFCPITPLTFLQARIVVDLTGSDSEEEIEFECPICMDNVDTKQRFMIPDCRHSLYVKFGVME